MCNLSDLCDSGKLGEKLKSGYKIINLRIGEDKMEKGDKLISVTRWFSDITNLSVRMIVKVNKTTYKLNDGTLIYKDGLYKRGRSQGISTSRTTYEKYSEEKYNEYKREVINDKKSKLKSVILRETKMYNKKITIDVLNEIVKELESEVE